MMELGVAGTHFPSGRPMLSVSVVGDFNGTAASMRCAKWFRRAFGNFRSVCAGAHIIKLRFVAAWRIDAQNRSLRLFAQHGTQTGCMVYDIVRHGWNDADWMEQRKHRDRILSDEHL